LISFGVLLFLIVSTHVLSSILTPPRAGRTDDLHSFDKATMVWTLLSADDSARPAARAEHGFASAGGLLYVHGGNPGLAKGGST
jgi:hypothetical protein